MLDVSTGAGITIDELRGEIRTFAEREVAPLATTIDEHDAFPRDLWPKLGALGVLGPTVADADGGAGLGFLAHLVIVEELSRASASVGMSYAATRTCACTTSGRTRPRNSAPAGFRSSCRASTSAPSR